MRTIILILFFSVCAFFAQAQRRLDSTTHLRVGDLRQITMQRPAGTDSIYRTYPDGSREFLYRDSVELRAAGDIAGKLNISDTASMLSPYARTVSISGKVNASDTAAMLVPYLRKIDTTSMLSTYARSNSVALKVNISDTAAMILPYLRKVDTTAMLTPYLRGNVAEATYQPLGSYATVAQNALKVNISDTGSMLSTYARSNAVALKVNISDTAAMVLPYLRKVDTTSMLSPYLRSNVAAATYQASDADLNTIAGLTPTTDNFLVSVASAWASRTVAQVKTTLAIDNVNNTTDANKPISTATQTALDAKQASDADLTTIAGLTATTDNFLVSVASAWASRTPAEVKTTLSLNNVTNTSDANKPVSTAQQTALDLKANLISPSLTTPSIGVATGTSLAATGAITSSGGGIGYATGAGGTVTQATNKSTGVTLNKLSGQITMSNAALAASTTVTFTLTNSFIAATDVLVFNHQSGGTAGAYRFNAQAAAGSATINVRNITAGSLSEAVVIKFIVIKGVTN